MTELMTATTPAARFAEAIARAHEARQNYIESFRQTALALGDYSKAMEESIGLARELGHAQLGTLPHHAAAINELKGGLNPYAGWVAESCKGYGWDLKVPPVAAFRETYKFPKGGKL